MFCILAVNHKRSIERERERERMAESHNEPGINEIQPAESHNEPGINEIQPAELHNEPGINETQRERERMEEGHNEREISEIQRQLSRFQILLSREGEINEQERESFKGLLCTNPQLFKALDSQQQSLLHLASANGHIEIVKMLIEARPEMCLARDRDGANPLHVAAMRGKVKVLDQWLEAHPHAARAYRVDNSERETILHLCVKFNQLHCLEILLGKYFRGDEFVNAKDNVGSTILHLAVEYRREEIVWYLLFSTKIDVNAVNASKQTALDIVLSRKKRGTQLEELDEYIQDLLEMRHAKTAREADILDPTEIAEKRSGIIVATVLMATLAFQAGVAPPGGVWQDDKDGHQSGKAVMASNHPIMYSFFLCYNILGFISSLGTLVLMMTDLPFKPGRYTWLTFVTMSTTITSIAIAYSISLLVVSPPLKRPEPITKFVLAPAGSVILLLLLIAIIAAMTKRTIWALVRVIRHMVMVIRRRLDRQAFDREGRF